MESDNPKATRKRKREEKLKQYGIDLPDIPGIPVEIIPLHVHALRVTSKFFQNDASECAIAPFPDQAKATEQLQKSIASSKSPLDSIFQRIEAAEARAEQTEEERLDARERARQRQEAIESWLQAIYRHLRDRVKQDNAKESAALGVMKHLWEIALEHKRVTARRSALHLAGHLLDKSAECRKWLLDEGSSLMEWMDEISSATTGSSSTATAKLSCLQREGYLLLRHLQERFGAHYPTMEVALRRYQLLFPEISISDTTTVTDMNFMDWRRIRDVAMQYADEEEKRVRKLISKVQTCLDVLVPRIGRDNIPPSTDDYSDDEDVEWEDGWEGEDQETSGFEISHAAAVEQTLTTMQSAKGLRGEGIVIDMRSGTDDKEAHKDEVETEARGRLEKCVNLLGERHIKRLSKWVDALTMADNLYVCEDGERQALVTLSQERIERRRKVLSQMMDLKNAVSTALASAQRLGIRATASERLYHDRQSRTHPAAINLVGTNSNRSLADALARRRPKIKDSSHARSSKIQIKFNRT